MSVYLFCDFRSAIQVHLSRISRTSVRGASPARPSSLATCSRQERRGPCHHQSAGRASGVSLESNDSTGGESSAGFGWALDGGGDRAPAQSRWTFNQSTGQVHQRRHIGPSCNSEAAPALEKARLDYSGHGHSALAPCPLNYGANQGLRWVPGCGRYQLLLATNTTACNFEGFCLGVRGYGAGPGLQLAPNSNSD